MTWQPDYITLQEFKDYKKIGDTVDDVDLSLDITAASRAVDDCCNRQFGLVAAEERTYFATYWDCGWITEIDDLMSTAGLVVELEGTATVDYTLLPVNAAQKGKPWTRIKVVNACQGDELTMTAPWGWTAFPPSVKFATRLQADRFSVRRDSPWGVAGSPQLGNEMRLLSKVDPDVRVALKSYIRPRAVG